MDIEMWNMYFQYWTTRLPHIQEFSKKNMSALISNFSLGGLNNCFATNPFLLPRAMVIDQVVNSCNCVISYHVVNLRFCVNLCPGAGVRVPS